MPTARLQKLLSAAGIASRRAAEALILDGRVTVNGETITELGSKADPDVDEIRLDGRRVKTTVARRYILMYKPRGYITTRSDPEQRPTVIDLLTTGGVRDYVYPVGRLDYESEGLLLLTSDGDLAERLMHPSHGVEREYHVRVRGVPDRDALRRLAGGVMLDGRKTAPADVEVVKTIAVASGEDALLSIVIHEGRNRQVRRMCEAVGHQVVRLRRVRIGPIHDEHIRPGEFRDLTEKEVAVLKRVAASGPAKAGPHRKPASHSGAGAGFSRPDRSKRTPQHRGAPSTLKHPIAHRADAPRTARDPKPRVPQRSGRPRRG